MILAWPHFTKIERYAVFLWLLLLAGLLFYISYQPYIPTSADYYYAARQWLSEQNIYQFNYEDSIHSLYFPQAVILYQPFAIFPFHLSEAIWRVFLVLLFSCSLWSFKNLIQFSEKWFYFVLTVVSAVIIVNHSLLSGQSNLAIVAFFLFALVAISQEKWWVASIMLTFALAFKPMIFFFLITLLILYRPLRLKLFLLIMILIFSPFLFGSPDYVLDQYKNFYISFFRYAQNYSADSASLFGLLNIFVNVQNALWWAYFLQLGVGLLFLGCSYYVKRYYPPKLAVILIYTFGACYLLLANPATVSNDYILLVPVLVWFAFYFYRQKIRFFAFAACIAAFCVGDLLTGLYGSSLFWLRPLTTVFFVVVLTLNLSRLRQVNL